MMNSAYFTCLFSLIGCEDANPDCAGHIYDNGGPEEYCNEPRNRDYVKKYCRQTCNINNCKWSIPIICLEVLNTSKQSPAKKIDDSAEPGSAGY